MNATLPVNNNQNQHSNVHNIKATKNDTAIQPYAVQTKTTSAVNYDSVHKNQEETNTTQNNNNKGTSNKQTTHNKQRT